MDYNEIVIMEMPRYRKNPKITISLADIEKKT